MKKYSLLLVMIVAVLLAACGGNDGEEKVEVSNNAAEEIPVNEENNSDEETDHQKGNHDGNYEIDRSAFMEVDMDADKILDDIYDYYDSIYYADADFIDTNDAISSYNAAYTPNTGFADYVVSFTQNIEEIDDRLYLQIKSSDFDYSLAMKREDDDGNKQAKQIKDDLYHYKDDYIWLLEDSAYSLSAMEEVDNLEETMALAVYENMKETNNELDKHEAFYREVIYPSHLPDGLELDEFRISRVDRNTMPQASVLLIYSMENQDKYLSITIDGEYSEEPTIEKDAEEFVLEDITFYRSDVNLLFTIDDVTYTIYSEAGNYSTEQLLGIAMSIVEQVE